MRFIDKNPKNIPKSLIRHKAQPHSTYENYPEKDDLREALLKEQQYLCCYCMRRIQMPTEEKMKIEHFKPFSIYNGTKGKEDLTLNYGNLLATCKGGEGGLKGNFHCDKSKGNKEIRLNPTDKSLMDLIKFTAAGEIYTNVKDLDTELDEVLCLNTYALKEERKEVWKAVEQVLKKQFGNKTVTKSFINEKIRHWETVSERGEAKPFVAVVLYHLRKKLAKAE
jgi:uncharacterized protein (TIGR02646 family)